MSSELFPKEFTKTTQVLPFTKYGLSSIKEFKDTEKEIHQLEWLKKAGLTTEEIVLYKENEAGLLNRNKMESKAMKEKLEAIYSKVKNLEGDTNSSDHDIMQPSTSVNNITTNKTHSLYPEGHPMNSIEEMEHKLFGHLKTEPMLPITKRRKELRRLERKKERILAQDYTVSVEAVGTSRTGKPGSLWDVKEMPQKRPKEITTENPVIGPKKRTMYSIKNNKIVRLEPVDNDREFKAVKIVTPMNDAEVKLLEGTKMAIDDIKKIDRFKDYTPGVPSKTLFLKNIAPSVNEQQLSLLFNQYTFANGAAIDVRLMSGRMRGQAFVAFQSLETATQALEDTNGTILSGRPIIAVFGRSNRIDNNR